MRALLLAAVVSALSLQGAQTPSPVFRSGTEVVRFDVRVTDGAGRPIADLRPDEIEIVEDGRPRPVLLFQHFQEPAREGEAYGEAKLRAVSAEVSSNRGSPRGHLYLLVFDQRHITTGNEQIARRAAESFLKTALGSADRVAVYGIPGPGPSIGFTADRTRALAELRKVQGTLERTVTSAAGKLSIHEAYEAASGNDAVVSAILLRQSADLSADVGAGGAGVEGATRDRAVSRAAEDPAVMRRVIVENARTVVTREDEGARDSLMRLADVVEEYRTVEGRKTVLFFSEGFHQGNVTRELERVAAAAAESYAVFYSFDLNRRVSQIDQAVVQSTTDASEIQSRVEPLGNLAIETDGELVNDATTHLDAAMARLAAQTQDYYLVGFSPSASAIAAPGSYRRVSVRVRRPGARVSARTGYALPAARTPPRRLAIDAALAAPFAQQALRVDYTTYALRADSAGRARVILSLDAELPLRDGTNGNADVVFVVKDMRDGRVVASGTDTMPLPAHAADGSSTGSGSFRVHFDVPPGTYMMRTVVREPGGLVGSADRKLEVRGFAGPDVTVSDLILGSANGVLPVRARAYTQDGLSGIVETYGRTGEQLRDVTVTASLVSIASGTARATFRADVAGAVSSGSGYVRRALLAAPLAGVPAGQYVARVKVTAGGETIADLTREVDVVDGTAPPPPPPPAPELRPRDVLESEFVKSTRAALRTSGRPGSTEATKGFDLFERAEYNDACTALAAAFAAQQDNAPLAFVLGWAYEAAGDHRHAIGSWRAAATIDPKLLPAHLALAEAYLRIAEPALAAQAVRAGLAALPDSPELQAKLAQILRQ
jgi:VWFA-related protein